MCFHFRGMRISLISKVTRLHKAMHDCREQYKFMFYRFGCVFWIHPGRPGWNFTCEHTTEGSWKLNDYCYEALFWELFVFKILGFSSLGFLKVFMIFKTPLCVVCVVYFPFYNFQPTVFYRKDSKRETTSRCKQYLWKNTVWGLLKKYSSVTFLVSLIFD